MKRSLPALALLCLGLTAAAATVHASPNLLANPGFDVGGGSYTGYFTFGSGVQLSTPATDNIALTGTAAAKVYGGFTGCPGSPVFNVGGFGQAFTNPVAGRVYTFSGYSFVSSTDPMLGTDVCNKNRLIAKLVFFNALTGGAEISSNEYVLGSGLTPQNQWVPFSIDAPVPSTARRVEALILFLQPGCDAGSVFVDDLSLTADPPTNIPNALTNPSFSTGLTGWTTFGNVYADTRNFTVASAPGAAKMFSTFVVDSPSGMYQTVPATAGTTYELSAAVRNTCQESPINLTNDNFVLGRISFRSAANVELGGNDVTLTDNTAPLGTYVRKSVQAVAPAGTASVQAYILFISPTLQGGAVFVDDVNLHAMNAAGAPLASSLQLSAPVPNPTRGATRVDFTLPREGDASVQVLDVAGRLVASLHQGTLAAGPHTLSWDGRTSKGVAAANGMYRVVLRADGVQAARSLVLMH